MTGHTWARDYATAKFMLFLPTRFTEYMASSPRRTASSL